MKASYSYLLLSGMMVTGCAMISTSQSAYRPPAASGLVGVRPYPTPSHVCQVIGENDLTIAYLDDAALLIGCPAAEFGAISDQMGDGAMYIDQVGDWILLSKPFR